MDDLIAHAETHGLRVKWRDLGRRNGELTTAGLILLNPRKTHATQRLTLAHEIGHHRHGHDWTRTHEVVRDERQADTYAARLLITPEMYREAEQLVGDRTGALAKELNVAPIHIELWRESWRQEIAARSHLRLA